MEQVRLTFLGGLGGPARNCLLVEAEGRIVIVDFGYAVARNDDGTRFRVVPDLEYLRQNANRVEACVVTHGHEDHVGGLAYLLQEMSVPIYSAPFTLGLARQRLEPLGLAKDELLRPVVDGEYVQLGPIGVEFIPATHSIPQAFGLALHTPAGVIYHSGDFKIDLDPVDGRFTNLSRIGELAQNPGIRLLLSESTNIAKAGFTKSESSVKPAIEALFDRYPDRRVVIGASTLNLHRLALIIDAAKTSGRFITPVGAPIRNALRIGVDTGAISLPDSFVWNPTELDDYAPSQVCVLTSGSQSESTAPLLAILNGEDTELTLGTSDVVIFTSHPIPGNAVNVARFAERLEALGPTVVQAKESKISAAGHAKIEELRLLLALAKPQAFIPIHGREANLAAHASLARDMGVVTEDIMTVRDGDTVLLTKSSLTRGPQVPAPVKEMPHLW